MEVIEPGAAGSGSKHAKKFAMLLPFRPIFVRVLPRHRLSFHQPGPGPEVRLSGGQLRHQVREGGRRHQVLLSAL